MPLKQDNLDRQLATAREDLAARTKMLEAAGKTVKECRKDPAWRNLNARCRTLSRRHKAAVAVVTLTAEADARRNGETADAAAEE